MQLDLFQDTGEGCSFVARPVRTNTDGKNKDQVMDRYCEDCGLHLSQYQFYFGHTCKKPEFDGETYEPEHDAIRLGKQALAVMELMRDGQWRTLREITEAIGGGSEAGVSARLRDFRKSSFGGHVVNRRRRGAESAGVFEYQVIVNENKDRQRNVCRNA